MTASHATAATAATPTAARAPHWEVFCQVVDNWGDLGVCWRLCCNLAERGQAVRLWVDEPAALQWMAPQGQAGVQLCHWPPTAPVTDCGSVLIEAFGTEFATLFIASCAMNTKAIDQFDSKNTSASTPHPLWINLEYLSAEPFVDRNHQLPSPILHGPAQGHTRWFFYPGFTQRTGGLLRERDLPARQAAFSRQAWLAQKALPPARDGERFISLFCYESPALPALLMQLAQSPAPSRLLVTHGRAAQAVKACLSELFLSQIGLSPVYSLRRQLSNSEQFDSLSLGQLQLHLLPPLTQTDYDHLLWASDLNMVRGEDSLVRALWAGKPFIWHIYPQSDGAHAAKLDAFLDWMDAPQALREAHWAWNATTSCKWPALDLQGWSRAAAAAGKKLDQQTDLAAQLLRFAARKNASSRTA